jgi:AcrR family transcriptional regulator
MARPPAKKADIEAAALKLFAANGIAETTVRDIAEEAGVTEGALYRHYPSKNEMAWKLFCREVERLALPLAEVLQRRHIPFADRVREAVKFLYGYYGRRPVEFTFVLLTQHGFPARTLPDRKRNPNDLVIDFLRRAVAEGQIPRVDAALAAALVMGCVLEPLVMHRYGRLRKEPAAMAAAVSDACLALLGPRGAGR